jgi:hypothetical protein
MKMNPIQVARLVADEFERHSIPYAIGGSMAMAGAGYVRATEDVDASLFIEPEKLDEVLTLLRHLNAKFNEASVQSSIDTRSDFKVYIEGIRVDLFLSFSKPFFDSMQSRLIQLPLNGKPAWFITPEDLAVLKMLFLRPKDLLDLERMLAVAGSRFDAGYVLHWLVELMGDTDSRIARWNQLVKDVAQSLE